MKQRNQKDNLNTGSNQKIATGMAFLAAVLYGFSSPVSKILLAEIPATLMAALLYLGAGLGMLFVNLIRKNKGKKSMEAGISKKDMPYTILMILLDIAAPVLLMIGLTMTTASNAALLNNFEIVATSLIALLVFKEAVGARLWIAIGLISISSIILTVKDFSSLTFSVGSVFIVAACLSWGMENNCTRMLSLKDPLQIVVIKGFGSGLGALIISLVLKEYSADLPSILLALLLGFVAYGLSIYFYIFAQRTLGAARTSAYYAAAPFVGVLLSWIFLREEITGSFLIALVVMIAGSYFAVTEKHRHTHLHTELIHEHKHNHEDLHHNHKHDAEVIGEHSHVHTHEAMEHKHAHTPDIHHHHSHN